MALETITFKVSGAASLASALKQIPVLIGRWMSDGYELCIEVFDAKTRAQERLVHSCYRDLSRDCLLGGSKNDEEAWKRALLQAFYEATRYDPDLAADWKRRAPRMVPSLDGDGVVWVGIESKKFTKKLYTNYITFVHATGDQRGVRWSRTSLGRDVPEEYFAEAQA